MVLGLKPTGKLDTLKQSLEARQNQDLTWSSTQAYGETRHSETKPRGYTEPRPCMVLRLKPMGKLDTLKQSIEARQNQGLTWFSDSSL